MELTGFCPFTLGVGVTYLLTKYFHYYERGLLSKWNDSPVGVHKSQWNINNRLFLMVMAVLYFFYCSAVRNVSISDDKVAVFLRSSLMGDPNAGIAFRRIITVNILVLPLNMCILHITWLLDILCHSFGINYDIFRTLSPYMAINIVILLKICLKRTTKSTWSFLLFSVPSIIIFMCVPNTFNIMYSFEFLNCPKTLKD